MIVGHLTGGLGNQLFQYCCARTLAQLRGVALKLDRSVVARDAKRSYSLGAWNIPEDFASRAEVLALKVRHRIDLRLHPEKPYFRRAMLIEREIPFDPHVLNESLGSCLVIGYWGNEQYFKPIESIIRRELTLRHPISDATSRLAERIAKTESVFLHVRRGDFVNDSETAAQMVSLETQYYRAAFAYVLERVSEPHFFVFSDEPEWAKRNLDVGAATTFVDHNAPGDRHRPGREHEDLFLMSLCRHGIMANSTFSWWGAWLNPTQDRIVIAPSRWELNPRSEPAYLLKWWVKLAN